MTAPLIPAPHAECILCLEDFEMNKEWPYYDVCRPCAEAMENL